jgi:DNA-binding transcriptional regulator YiaG
MLAKQRVPTHGATSPGVPASPLRFVAKGLRSLRARLGLSAPELARLIGVSDQTVYNWELKKTVPRKSQLATLANVRSLGKREARSRLDSLAQRQTRKKK